MSEESGNIALHLDDETDPRKKKNGFLKGQRFSGRHRREKTDEIPDAMLTFATATEPAQPAAPEAETGKKGYFALTAAGLLTMVFAAGTRLRESLPSISGTFSEVATNKMHDAALQARSLLEVRTPEFN